MISRTDPVIRLKRKAMRRIRPATIRSDIMWLDSKLITKTIRPNS